MTAFSLSEIKSLIERSVTTTLPMTVLMITSAVEQKLLSIPRPLKDMETVKLEDRLVKLVGGAAANVYAIKTGKNTSFFLVNRQLNKAGKVMSRVGLGMELVLGSMMVHELWARSKEPEKMTIKDARDSLRDIKAQPLS